MSEPNRALSEVPALLEERRKYEGWIAALEARRESTAPHVYERVSEDYRSRLQRVEAQLSTFRDALEAERYNIAARVAQIEGEEQRRRDERAELELRVEVGELNAGEASTSFRTLDDTLRHLESEKATLHSQVGALAKLLGGEGASGVTDTAPVGDGSEEREPRPSTPGGSFDELAFLSSVVPADETPAAPPKKRGRASQTPPLPVAPAPPPPMDSRLESIEIHDSDLAALSPRNENEPSLLSGITGSAPDATQVQASETLLKNLRGGKTPRRTDTPPLAGRGQAPGATPLSLRSTASGEQPKTLKCTECGAMNYPTEWYCERCGAELAAL